MQRLTVRLIIFLLAFIISLPVQSVWSGSDYIIERCGEFMIRGQD